MEESQAIHFNNLTNPNQRLKKQFQSKYFIISFILPLLILGISYAVQGIFPFGDKHILTIDLYHQYAPFLRELQSKLLSGDSLFISWSGGLGFNFFSVITYYLASPFNLLLVLFTEQQISDAVLLITLLKIATSGLTFYLYSYFSRNKHSWFYVAISSGYALSGYSLAYSWNIMWLDTILLLPLVILGLIYLIRNKNNWLYIVSLAAILISNYYTAFFVCVFLFCYYWVLYVQEKNHNYSNLLKSKKQGFLTFLKFGFGSLLSAGLAAITLLPTISALARTSASGDVFPDSINFFEPFIDFISRLLTLSPLSIRDGMPNLYAGVILLILLPLFFSNKKISSATKIAHAVLIFFLIISLNNNVLNFIWHGFHYPNQLPFRNSFVLIFLFCTMAITAYDSWEIQDKYPWFKLLGSWIILLLILQKIDQNNYAFSLILVSIILLFFFILILYTAQDTKTRKKYVSIMLLIVMVVELLINTVIGINSINENEYYGSRDGYLAGDMPASILKRVEEIKEDDPNARISLWPDKSVNDPMLYGYPGLTVFSSTYPEKPVQLIANLGYDNNGINSYQNTGSNIILDSVFGLKYKILDQTREEQLSFYEPVSTDGLTALYKNNYALPLLYLVPNQAVNFSSNASNTSFVNQKNLISSLGGDSDLLQSTISSISDYSGCTVTETVNNKYQVDLIDNSEEAVFSFEVRAQQPGYYTIAWDASAIKFNQVYLTWPQYELNNLENTESKQQNLSRKSTSIADIGYLESGETVKVHFSLNSDDSSNGDIEFEAALIDKNKFESWNSQLALTTLNPTKHSSNHLSGNINSPEVGYLLFTSTYDPGWQVEINNESVEIESFDDALILIPLNAGDNQIEMKFKPVGFTQGIIITSISILISLSLLAYKVLLKRKSVVSSKQDLVELEPENSIRQVSLKLSTSDLDKSNTENNNK